MFSDCLALAFMALVFISALECICWKEEIAILQQQKRQKEGQKEAKEWPEAISAIITLLLGEDLKNTATTKVTTRVEK